MSFTVDPNDKLKLGSGVIPSVVVSVAYCYRLAATGQIYGVRNFNSQCGQYVGMPFKSSAPACSGPLVVSECGATGSTALDSGKHPRNVLKDDDTFWCPHIRMGDGWKDFLVFDFRSNARVISVLVQPVGEGIRRPTSVSVAVSNTGVSWTTVVQRVAIPEDGVIPIIPAQEARYVFQTFLLDMLRRQVCPPSDGRVLPRPQPLSFLRDPARALVRLPCAQRVS